LVADDLTDKAYAVQRIMAVEEHIYKRDVEVKEILVDLPKSKLL
jgi:hypothetical protein